MNSLTQFQNIPSDATINQIVNVDNIILTNKTTDNNSGIHQVAIIQIPAKELKDGFDTVSFNFISNELFDSNFTDKDDDYKANTKVYCVIKTGQNEDYVATSINSEKIYQEGLVSFKFDKYITFPDSLINATVVNDGSVNKVWFFFTTDKDSEKNKVGQYWTARQGIPVKTSSTSINDCNISLGEGWSNNTLPDIQFYCRYATSTDIPEVTAPASYTAFKNGKAADEGYVEKALEEKLSISGGALTGYLSSVYDISVFDDSRLTVAKDRNSTSARVSLEINGSKGGYISHMKERGSEYVVYFPLKDGTLALLSDIPDVSNLLSKDDWSKITEQDITDFLNYKGEPIEGMQYKVGDVLVAPPDPYFFYRVKSSGTFDGGMGWLMYNCDEIYAKNEGKTGLERLIAICPRFGVQDITDFLNYRGKGKATHYKVGDIAYTANGTLASDSYYCKVEYDETDGNNVGNPLFWGKEFRPTDGFQKLLKLFSSDNEYLKTALDDKLSIGDIGQHKFPPELVSQLDTRPSDEDSGKAASARQVFDKLAGKRGSELEVDQWCFIDWEADPLIWINKEVAPKRYSNGVYELKLVRNPLTKLYSWVLSTEEGSLSAEETDPDAKELHFGEFTLIKQEGVLALTSQLSGITAQDITDFLNYKGECDGGVDVGEHKKGDVWYCKTQSPLHTKSTIGFWRCNGTISGYVGDSNWDFIYAKNEGKTGLERLIDLFGKTNNQLANTINNITEFNINQYLTKTNTTSLIGDEGSVVNRLDNAAQKSDLKYQSDTLTEQKSAWYSNNSDDLKDSTKAIDAIQFPATDYFKLNKDNLLTSISINFGEQSLANINLDPVYLELCVTTNGIETKKYSLNSTAPTSDGGVCTWNFDNININNINNSSTIACWFKPTTNVSDTKARSFILKLLKDESDNEISNTGYSVHVPQDATFKNYSPIFTIAIKPTYTVQDSLKDFAELTTIDNSDWNTLCNYVTASNTEKTLANIVKVIAQAVSKLTTQPSATSSQT